MIYVATKEVIKEMTANQAVLVNAKAGAFIDYITTFSVDSELKQKSF